MILIKCHECGRDVSSGEKACPNCAAKIKKPMGRTGKMAIGASILFFLAMQYSVDKKMMYAIN